MSFLHRPLPGLLGAFVLSACIVRVASGQISSIPSQSSSAYGTPANITRATSGPLPSNSNSANGSGGDNVKRTSGIAPVRSTVFVNAALQESETGQPTAYHITRNAVQSSAGTWGDFTRYLQLMPGVVWNSDLTNEMMVRGGNPSENLYVVDGIEIPNINHIALEGTTGGFASMIDTSSISGVDLKPGPYDPQFAGRLSSLIEIHTRENESSGPTGEVDAGISGGGGLLLQPLGKKADLLLTAHRSVLNLVTNDIGINGVPIYTNGLARLEWSPSSRNRISALSLNGADSLNMTPEPCDPGATLNVQTQYSGTRSTDGLAWTHIYNPSVFSTLVGSWSGQGQNIAQQLQATAFNGKPGCDNDPIETTPVYSEDTHDGTATLSYGLHFGLRDAVISAGGRVQALTTNYAVDQPLGQQSPFNANPAWTDADMFARILTTGVTGSYAEVTARLKTRWTLISGAREETFSLIGAHTFEPSASLAFRISNHQNINASWGRTAQMPPVIDILSYPQNNRLSPLRVEEYSVGGDLWHGSWASLHGETYSKRYTDEPVSTEYPSLMLANMVDTLGQFVWLPLRTGGFGQAGGVEILLRAHAADRLDLMGSASYSRTRYAAEDGILRPGNFDFPLVGNGTATARLWKGFQISARDTYETGRPYTPFNIPLSEQQSRGIYDLTRINSSRGAAYNRVDADINRDFRILRGVLNIHGGVENAFDRSNFLGYVWMDNCHPRPGQTYCGMNQNAVPGVPETEVTQMPQFPSASLRYTF